jgi:hypothetical protein
MTLHLILIDPITEMSSYSRFLFHFLARFMSRFESDLAVSVITHKINKEICLIIFLMEQILPIFLEHMCSPVFNGFRMTKSLVFVWYFVDHSHCVYCIVSPSTIYGF